MTKNTKLLKVLEHLTKGDDDAARDLLHTVFIEKARAIHEELMSADEAAYDEMEDGSMEEMVGGSGDMGKDLTNEIEALENEIDFEETMSEEGDMPAPDMGDEMPAPEMGDEMPAPDMPDSDMGDHMGGDEDHDMGSVEQKMDDLESALAALKAEFEKLEAEEAGEDEEDAGEEAEEAGEDEEEAGEEEEEAGEDEEEAGEEEEEEMEENWSLDEDFDDLAESLNLEVVEKDMEKSAKTPDEVGAGKSGMSKGENAKSPLPASQTSRMGAKPVETGKGPTHNGYKLEAAPKSAQLAGTSDNRRKKSTQGMGKVSTPAKGEVGSGHSGMSTGDKAMSPLSKGGQNLKAGK